MDLTYEPQIIDELFRKVRSEEILDDLKELGVAIRENTLTNPSAEEALGLYGLAIQVVLGKTRTDIRPEDVYSQIHVFSSPVEGLEITQGNLEFLKRGIGNLRFWRYCQRLHHVLGLPAIERYELFSPTPDSFYRFISAFVVYLRFREALKTLFEDSVARLNFFTEQEAQLEDNLHRVRTEFDNFQRLKEENLLDLEASVSDRERLEKLLLQAKAVFNEHKEAKANVDSEIERTRTAINDIQLKRAKLKHLNESLTEQVVSDPDVLYHQKSDMEAQDAIHLQNLKNLEDTYERTKIRLRRLQGCNDFMVLIRDKLNQHLEEVLRPLVDNASVIKSLNVRNEVCHEQIKHQKIKREEAQNSLQNARLENEQRLRLAEENAENNLKLARKFADDTHDHTKHMQQQLTHKIGEIEALRLEWTKRHDSLINTFRDVEVSLQKLTLASASYAEAMNVIMQSLHRTLPSKER